MERDQAQAPAAQSGQEQEAPRAQQRDGLHGLLRGLDFLQGEAALKPPEDGGSPQRPKVDPGLLTQLLTLVPTALTELGEAPESKGDAPQAQKPEARSQEEEEAEDAVAQLGPAEAESDAAEGDEAEEQEHAPPDAAVQHKKKPAKKAPAKKKPAAKHKAAAPAPRAAAKAAQDADGPSPAELLPLPRAKAALRWSARQGFGKTPFLIRRFQVALGDAADGRLDVGFVRSVAEFQHERGIKPVSGKLAGRTARLMKWRLVHLFGLKGGLTTREVKMAQHRSVGAIRAKQLSWKTVKELRKLFGMPKQGGLSPAFLRKVAQFQAKHHIGQSGYLSKGTVSRIRSELGESNWSAAIYRSAMRHKGMSTRSGPDGGNLACAWAVNIVLKDAIGHAIGGNAVSGVEGELQSGQGMRVKMGQEKPGDIVLIPGSHIGIVTGKGTALSNSSSRATFSWVSDLSFNPVYGGTPHIYRVKKKQ